METTIALQTITRAQLDAVTDRTLAIAVDSLSGDLVTVADADAVRKVARTTTRFSRAWYDESLEVGCLAGQAIGLTHDPVLFTYAPGATRGLGEIGYAFLLALDEAGFYKYAYDVVD